MLKEGNKLLLEPWQPPKNEGYTGPFAENSMLHQAKIIDLGGLRGPEDIAIHPNTGQVFFSSEEGIGVMGH